MPTFPIFLSVVVVVRNQSSQLENLLKSVESKVGSIVSDYELVVVDNASCDDSIQTLKQLVGEDGLPNLQVYALTKEVGADVASWVGLQNALGDFVAVVDLMVDDVGFLADMLAAAVKGADVVFANNSIKPHQGMIYRFANKLFNSTYKLLSGVDLQNEAPHFRLLSKRLVNFILQHPQPAITYRHLPATGGFVRVNLSYSLKLGETDKKKFGESVDRGMRLLVSTTRAPMRIVTTLSLFGAFANLAYSIYVIVIGLTKADVAPGWISLSLQQSGMFFLISLVLLVLGEYILHMTSLSNEGPAYHVAQEFTSARLVRREKLNLEVVASS